MNELPELKDRNESIRNNRLSGKSYEEIGKIFDLCPARIKQICNPKIKESKPFNPAAAIAYCDYLRRFGYTIIEPKKYS